MARAFHAAVAAANRACALAIAITTANGALGGDAVIPAIAADESSLTRLCEAHGEHCGCPGCRAYFHNCDSPCEPGSAPGPADPGTEELPIATDEPSDEGALDSFTGPLPALSGGLGAVAASNSAAPNLIGDSPIGGCGGLNIDGVLAASIAHPLYACSRLNIAENNSALVRDRYYVTYRHFHNASFVDLFSYSPQGGYQNFNTDQYTVALEKRAGDWTSFEFRLPISTQLSPNLEFTQDANGNNLGDVFADGRSTDVGNFSIIAKHVLHNTRSVTFSAGLGLNIPTAPDFTFSGQINDPSYDIYDPTLSLEQNIASEPVPTANLVVDAFGIYRNETVNLQPFVAYQWRPNSNFYSNGFVQFDIPLNESTGQIAVNGSIDSVPITPVDEAGEIAQQSLVRVNMGGGVWLNGPPRGNDRTPRVAMQFEVHYTGSLEPPDRQTVEIMTPALGSIDNLKLSIGPLADSTNALNLVFGLPVIVGRTTIYNGFGAPIREEADRGYDFEYSCTVQRPF